MSVSLRAVLLQLTAIILILTLPLVSAESNLFPFETIQLTEDDLTKIPSASLFSFATSDANSTPSGCKVFPGDAAWPSDATWSTFNTLLGGSLIATIPIAAPCYDNWPAVESAPRCTFVSDNWANSTLHMADPTSIMSPLFQGRTCMPTTASSASPCTLGGYPSYAINVSTVAQIQLAVNFARNSNIRFVVKNTGHDFLGKSTGAGALSVWMHHLKDIAFISEYNSAGYKGSAVKIGAGVQAEDVYAAAKGFGGTVVGGEGRTVGVAGGYVAGGGHSPLSSLYGMAADQVLSIEVVTPDGLFVTASPESNAELFWGLRGGGGATFGVVTSVTSKVYPVIPAATMKFTFATSANVSSIAFWNGVRAYFTHFVEYTDKGTYAYFTMAPTGPDSYIFSMAPFFAPNMTASQLRTLVQPWFNELAALGISVAPVINEYDNFYDAWWAAFPLEAIGETNVKLASRLFPKANWDDASSFNATFEAVKSTIQLGGVLLAFNIKSAANDGTDNAVNPAWRKTCLHAILGIVSNSAANDTVLATDSKTLTNDWMKRWRDVSPGAGAYLSEADVTEPDFQQAFFGTNYDRLYALKQKIDPEGLLYAPTAVGSENWYITDQLEGLPTQNGRLCRV